MSRRRRQRDRKLELERQLRRLPLAGEDEAEERGWELVRAAHGERTPVHPGRRTRRVAIGLGAGAVALAIGLSPAGAKMGDLVSEVVGIGEEEARPALRSLPAAGELLVESAEGIWIVQEDGSRRLLGGFEQAAWSPRGLYVVVAEDRELTAVDPLGEVRWSLSAPGPVADPRWGGIGDTRIAYRSGKELRVVAGDGSGDHLIAADVAAVAPAWRPPGDSKLEAVEALHVVSYVTADKGIRSVDTESGERVEVTEADLERLSTPAAGGPGNRALSPDGITLATLQRVGRRDELVVQDDGKAKQRVLFSASGPLTGPTWSPDGRWLLVGWPAADQWLFISTERRNRVVAFDQISEQFDPGGDGGGKFPRVSGWILPQR
jgi:hypothetical protein